MDRRTLLKAGAAGVAAAGIGVRPGRAQSGAIRIGVLAPLTGVVASGGREMVDGINLWFSQAGNTVAGRPVELIVEDDASNPDTALQKARRLVEQAEVHFLIGDLLANTGLAVANYVRTNGVPYFIPIIAADDLTQRDRIDNVVRVAGYSASQTTHPLGDWALRQGYRRMATISQDYTFGHEQCGGLAQVFTEGGGTIVEQFWHPLNTADFSPYIGQIIGLEIDALFAMETGADATRLIQQLANFGLKGRIPLLTAMNASDQSVIRTMGDECEGLISAAHFAEGADNAATQEFVSNYRSAYGTIPSLYGFSMYSGAMWISSALESIGGNAEDRQALLAAVRSTELRDSPLGRTVTLDAYGNPVYDIYIREVVRGPDGAFWNVPLETYPGVSQFWTYDPETYLQQPPYSRQFQGIAER